MDTVLSDCQEQDSEAYPAPRGSGETSVTSPSSSASHTFEASLPSELSLSPVTSSWPLWNYPPDESGGQRGQCADGWIPAAGELNTDDSATFGSPYSCFGRGRRLGGIPSTRQSSTMPWTEEESACLYGSTTDSTITDAAREEQVTACSFSSRHDDASPEARVGGCGGGCTTGSSRSDDDGVLAGGVDRDRHFCDDGADDSDADDDEEESVPVLGNSKAATEQDSERDDSEGVADDVTPPPTYSAVTEQQQDGHLLSVEQDMDIDEEPVAVKDDHDSGCEDDDAGACSDMDESDTVSRSTSDVSASPCSRNTTHSCSGQALCITTNSLQRCIMSTGVFTLDNNNNDNNSDNNNVTTPGLRQQNAAALCLCLCSGECTAHLCRA